MADERDIRFDDPTPIIPDWAYLADQCVSLEASLRRAAESVRESGRLIRAGRGSVQALEELREACGDRADQFAGAVRAIDRYLGVRQQDSNEGVRLTGDQPPQTALPPMPQPVALLAPMRPTLMSRLRRLAANPALHMALPVGALAYLRLTTGKWPSVEEWIAGGTLLVSRFGAMIDMLKSSLGGDSEDDADDAEPPDPAVAP